MTRTQPEARIVNAILAELNALPGCYARKTHGNRYSVGWPDIVGVHRGESFALEVKVPGKDATPRQAHELAKWRQAGALVGVVHDVDEALDVLGHREAVLTRAEAAELDRFARVRIASENRPRISAGPDAHPDAPHPREAGRMNVELNVDMTQWNAAIERMRR